MANSKHVLVTASQCPTEKMHSYAATPRGMWVGVGECQGLFAILPNY